MKFWLACFVLIFMGAELLQWMVQVSSGQLSAAWLILGGMGLAAASNASYLPRLKVGGSEADERVAGERPQVEREKGKKTTAMQTDCVSEAQRQSKAKIDRSEDSISFKVRFPWH